MCSIFHNRINYRGPRSGSAGTTGNGSATNESTSIVKDDPDRNNNSGGDEPQTRFQIHQSDEDDEADAEGEGDGEQCGEEGDGEKALDLSVMSRLPATGHVALEALQHTKVAVAQFAATAIANTQNYDEAVNDLAVVQSTIFNVQRQQLMQMQLIQHLQSQLKHRTNDDYDDDNDDEASTIKEEPDGCETPRPTSDPNPEKEKTDMKEVEAPSREHEGTEGTECAKAFQPQLCDISSSFASSIITNHDPPPLPNEPNCLEMLQRRTEEVLDSASQSVHANHLNDEYDYSKKDGAGRGEIFKHRCKYCGKIFGSYSALQIHLRSHTGERPFQCNVCGSKFTTKGNLKVHYQRHTQIFPPMLMPPSSSVEQYHHHHPNPGNPPPLRLPFPPFVHMPPFHHMDTSPNREKEPMPIEKKLDPPPQPQPQPQPQPTQTEAQDLRKATVETVDRVRPTEDKPKKEPVKRLETPLPPIPPAPDNRRKRSSTSRDTHSLPIKSTDENIPENLSKSSRRSSLSRASISSLEQIPSEYSLAQMERLIDKSWEDLIEIDKTSETSKLQQLVDNIENKLTDPNQCIFCQKVMSCRSSLQMHLRTHTGERPFRCKICGRAFATKGNLKAHMSIHKIKPPMRSQFKCPVCHQKFSNGIILQQHIRIHTIDDGDANDRSKANEICNAEDQSSTRSISTSDNMDFSQSEYSGQRSESSQGDFDDFTMASEEESPADGVYEDRRDDHKESEGGSNSDENGAIDLSAKSGQDNDRSSETASSAGVSLVPNFLLMPRDNRSPPKFPLLPFGPFGIIAGLRGVANICNICFRIFPSASELDLHIRSHTKEDNFKCSICDKGCVTKEEFHNHILAHRFHRDASDSNNQNSINLLNDDNQSDTHNRQFKSEVINLDHEKPLSPNGAEANSTLTADNHISGDAEHSLMKMQLLSSLPNESHIQSSSESSRFTPNQQDLQQNCQDQPANNKHFCTVCRRNFSSSSALQIHMRTHTGDKPFQCNVCQKAFTTKGNLKVHMGTHMWTNPASRRGRRMSLELPMHRPNLLPLGAHQDSEILTRRPEIFFPYLPPFFNGMQPKPMDVPSGSFSGLPPNPFPNGASQKYSDLIGFAPFLGPPYNFPPLPSLDRHMTKSPVDEPHSRSPQHSPVRGSTPQHHRQYNNQLAVKKDYHNDEYVKG